MKKIILALLLITAALTGLGLFLTANSERGTNDDKMQSYHKDLAHDGVHRYEHTNGFEDAKRLKNKLIT